jgi:stage V sporulation protein AF
MAYMKGKADKRLVGRIENLLQQLEKNKTPEALTVGDQSLLDGLLGVCQHQGSQSGHRRGGYGRADQGMKEDQGTKVGRLADRLNPFPKVRYSQRPDVIAAHIAEGKIAIIVDNSPTVMLVPVGVFDFFQDVDDYYFPQLTGNYFRMLRFLNFVVILFLPPIYLLLANQQVFNPQALSFFLPDEPYAIPLIGQFLLLELAVDGLKLASLNTPDSLGMSLSVIGALILGELSISSGWFIPQTILCMAVVSLASFTQPSIELSYGAKFIRVLILIGTWLLGIWGMALGALLGLLVLAFTKTLSGESYLYPLLPFRWDSLKRLLLRTRA